MDKKQSTASQVLSYGDIQALYMTHMQDDSLDCAIMFARAIEARLATEQWRTDRNTVLEEVAVWYADKGWLMDEEAVADAIRGLKEGAPAPLPAAQGAGSDEKEVWMAFNSEDDDEPVMFCPESPGQELKERFYWRYFMLRPVAAPSQQPADQPAEGKS